MALTRPADDARVGAAFGGGGNGGAKPMAFFVPSAAAAAAQAASQQPQPDETQALSRGASGRPRLSSHSRLLIYRWMFSSAAGMVGTLSGTLHADAASRGTPPTFGPQQYRLILLACRAEPS